MWKFEPFSEFINDVARCDVVSDIHIINNDVSKTPQVTFHPKIKVHDFPENTFVNPAWNYGVSVSRSDKICVMNDDVIYDIRILYRMDEFLERDGVGLVGISPGEITLGQVPITTGRIFITEIQNLSYGFGGLFFLKKEEWYDIPSEIKVFCGDNYQFEVAKIRGRQNYVINDSLFKTVYGTTSGSIVNHTKIYESDSREYLKVMRDPIKGVDYTQFSGIIEKEYLAACDAKTDINEHLPILKCFAERCKQVTEFGVRDGQSTRALLASGASLKSYDLFRHSDVDRLFNMARGDGRDVNYVTGNTLEIDIEPTDMLFIDTEHTYEQVKGELNRHHDRVRKYIAFHDTATFKDAIMPAIEEFLSMNNSWSVVYRVENNNGFMIIEKKDV